MQGPTLWTSSEATPLNISKVELQSKYCHLHFFLLSFICELYSLNLNKEKVKKEGKTYIKDKDCYVILEVAAAHYACPSWVIVA